MAGSKDSKKISVAKKARAKGSTSGPVPPYGEAIHEAKTRGDVQEMKKVASSARKWMKDVQTALDKLEQKIGKLNDQ